MVWCFRDISLYLALLLLLLCLRVLCTAAGPPAPCSVTRLRRSESLRVFTASREQLLYVHADTRRPGH